MIYNKELACLGKDGLAEHLVTRQSSGFNAPRSAVSGRSDAIIHHFSAAIDAALKAEDARLTHAHSDTLNACELHYDL